MGPDPALVKLIVIVWSSVGLSQTTSSRPSHLKALFIDNYNHLATPSSIVPRHCSLASSTMSAPRSVRCLRQAVRSLSTRPVAPRYLSRQAPVASHVATRGLSYTSRSYKGILPDTDEPTLKEREPLHEVNEPTPIEVEEYHERADQYLEELVTRAEELAEEKEGVDVEYSVSILVALNVACADLPSRPASSTSSTLPTAPTLSTSSPRPSKSG